MSTEIDQRWARMFEKTFKALLLVLLLAPAGALGHGGGLDSHGCHTDNQAGNYHYHQGLHAGKAFRNEAAYAQPSPGTLSLNVA